MFVQYPPHLTFLTVQNCKHFLDVYLGETIFNFEEQEAKTSEHCEMSLNKAR